MKTVKVSNMDITPPNTTSGDFETPPMCIAGHCVVLCVGKRRSGKTTACTSLVEKMGFDYVIAVSATMASNKELMSRLNIQHEFDPDDPMVIDKIKEIVEGEAADLERYQEEMRRYRKLMELIHSESPLFRLPEEDLAAFYRDGDFKPPEHRYNGRKPKIAVIFDDCLGSAVYSKPRKLNGLATYSRHVGQLKEGGAIGVSLFFLLQSYKCQSGGLNKWCATSARRSWCSAPRTPPSWTTSPPRSRGRSTGPRSTECTVPPSGTAKATRSYWSTLPGGPRTQVCFVGG